PLLVMPRRFLVRGARIWAKVTFALLAAICGLRHEIRGLENLPQHPCILASKHQSAWDTLIFALVVDGPSFVFKQELLWVPPLGWYIRHAGGIPINRKGGGKALRKMVDTARAVLNAGQYIVIFPEGTRVPPGERLAYHPGIAAFYSQLAVPVVPVAVNSGLFWGRRSFLKKPGVIVLEILPPIGPGLARKAFTARLEESIESASTRLLQEQTPAS
ncbi:MAG: lysophospholipid acyltransferase family protein, partial [Alphaproteobacteria bacterium]